jgi:MFS family permease
VTAETGTATVQSGALWRDRDFSIFWLSQTLSVVGDSFALIAVPLLVLHATGSVAQMGLLTGAAGAASIVAGVFAGVLADRLDRRRLLITCDLARLALYATIPLAWLAGPQVWLLYVVLPLCEAVGMVFSVTYVTVVRTLVGTGRVTQANGLLFAAAAAAGVTGPLLAGVVSGRFGPTAAVAINAGSFALSAAGMWIIRLSRTAGASEPSPRGRPLAELARGTFTAVDRHRLNSVPLTAGTTSGVQYFRFLMLGTQIPGDPATLCPGPFPACQFMDMSEIEVYGTPAS